MFTARPVALFRRGLAVVATVLLIAGVAPAPTMAVAPTNAPTLQSPTAGANVTGNPILQWSAVSGAVKYRVQVSTAPDFTSLAYNMDTANLRATPPTDLPLGTLYWRVAGLDAASALGPWGNSSFTKNWGAAPTPIAPNDAATLDYPSQPVLFRWNPLPGAATYTIEIDDAPDFIGATSLTTNNTSYTLTTPQTVGQTFYWHVRGNASSGGIVSAWSATRSYTYTWSALPQLRTPLDTQSGVTDVVFSWDPVPGAATYELQVSPNGDFANNVTLDAKGLMSTRYSPATTLDNGSYFWRVQASDSSGNKGGWSAQFSFTRGWADRPTEIAPVWDKNNPTAIPYVSELTLSWTPVDHASYYEVWVGTDVNFSQGTYTNCFTNRTQVTPYAVVSGSDPAPGGCTIPIHDLTLYYWKVRGMDGGRPVTGLWSEVDGASTWRFIYETPQITQLAPADSATVQTPVLSWSPVANVERYQVSIYKSNKTTLAKQVTTYATTYTPDALNPADGPFYWYVQTIDGTGNTSGIPAPGSWWSFSLTAPTTDTSMAILNPPDASTSVRMPSIQWMPYTGAAYYKVWYGPAGGAYFATPLSGSTQLTFAAYTYPSLTLAAGTYKFTVEAFDSGNVSLATSIEQTFTINSPDVLGTTDYLTPARCDVLSTCVAVADTPSLTWNPVPGAGAYKVILANDAQFTNPIVAFKTTFNRLTPRGSLLDSQAGHAIYWFVLPCVDYSLTRCGPSEQTSANANAAAFRKVSAAVAPLTPADDPLFTDAKAVPNQVAFSWREYLDTNSALLPAVTQEAKSYKITVSTAADFSTTLDTATVDQLTYTPFAKTYPEGPLYWRVQAIDQSGNTLTVSPTMHVKKASPVPQLSLPGNATSVAGVPYFTWSPLNYAASYTIEVYKNGDLGWSPGNKVLSATTKFTAWAPTGSLPSGVYAWRVRRTDAGGNVGGWSAGRTFTLQPAAPTLLSPANGQKLASTALVFAWSGVTGAVKYKWDVSASSAFTTITSTQITVMNAWAPTVALANGTWFWRVSALDTAGNVISTSSTASFSIDTIRPTVTAVSPASAPDISSPFTVTFSEPVKGVNSSSFRVLVGTTPVTGSVSVLYSTQARFTPTSRLVPGQTYTISLSAAITDYAGNPLVPYAKAIRASTVVQENSPAVSDGWARWTVSYASGGTMKIARKVGARLTVGFDGSSVTLVGARGPAGGYAQIYIDGVLKTSTASFYASAIKYQQTIYAATGLTAAHHTMVIVAAGTKPTVATGTWVYVDALKTASATIQDSSASVVDGFRHIATSYASGGAYDVIDFVAAGGKTGPALSFQFAGTGVNWYGTKGTTYGKAYVYIDGVYKATVDLYRSSLAYKQAVYASPTLTNAVHTIRILVVGAKQAASAGYDVSFDYFAVR